jgi:hypothetical protein
MKFYSICSAVTLTVILCSTAYAAAIPSSVDSSTNALLNTFTEFNWSPTVKRTNQNFEVSLLEPSRVHVTDLDPYGEGFFVYDNGVLVGETEITKDNDDGVNENQYRQGFFNLDKGHHIVTVKLKGNSGVGHGAIRIAPGKPSFDPTASHLLNDVS